MNDTLLSAIIHFGATVLREVDVVILAENQKVVSFLWFKVVRTDNNFSKMVLFMDLLKVFQCAEHSETVAVAVAIAFV